MLHEAWQEYWFRYSRSAGAVGYFLERRAVDNLDYIITISEYTKRRFLRWPLRAAKIGVIHPGVDFAEISVASPAGELSDVIFVGRLVEDAHVERLVRTVELLKRKHGKAVKAVVVGGGPMFASLARLAVELDVTREVRFTGPIEDHRRVYSLLKSSKVFLLPSAPHGGWNIASVEGNAAGIPIVAPSSSEIGFAGELVNVGHNGLIAGNGSPEELAGAVNYLLDNEPMRRRMGVESTLNAKQFEWRNVCQKTVTTYESLLAEQSSGE
jgi:glycosyltransferase involved in cell wall biosynthesis